MKYNRRFLRCPHCGNFVSFIEDSGVDISCCGEKMLEVKANSTDAAQEKHVPVVVREGNTVTVKVGSTLHPMTDEHHIAWVLVTQKDRMQRAVLAPAGEPSAEFTVSGGPVAVYAYCNQHGLWSAE